MIQYTLLEWENIKNSYSTYGMENGLVTEVVDNKNNIYSYWFDNDTIKLTPILKNNKTTTLGRINDWLSLADKPQVNGFPKGSEWKLTIALIFEELTELVESCGQGGVDDLEILTNKYFRGKNKLNYQRLNTNKNFVKYKDALADLIVAVSNGAYFANIDLDKEVNLVMDSNYTKYCTTEQEAKDTVKAYSNGTHPNKQGKVIDTYYVKRNDYYIILRKEDNKILKSINFKDAETMRK